MAHRHTVSHTKQSLIDHFYFYISNKPSRNTSESNNPTIEYFPAKAHSFAPASPQLPSPSSCLTRTLSSNLYPIVITLPMTDKIFMAANNDAMLYNWPTGLETNLPSFSNEVQIIYPFTGTGILLALSYQNGYEADFLYLSFFFFRHLS